MENPDDPDDSKLMSISLEKRICSRKMRSTPWVSFWRSSTNKTPKGSMLRTA